MYYLSLLGRGLIELVGLIEEWKENLSGSLAAASLISSEEQAI